MEAQNHATDESVSSGPCVDFQLNFKNNPTNHDTTSANSSNVGLGLELGLGAAHSDQDSYHQAYQNSNPGLGNFSPLQDLSLTLNMRSTGTSPHSVNITNVYQNWVRRQQAHSHNPMPFRLQSGMNSYHDDRPEAPKLRKRARDDDAALTHCTVRESLSSQTSLYTKGGTGKFGRMKNQSAHVSSLIAAKRNPSDGRPTNSVYDIMFEEVGLPMDPHLRLFSPL
ncbi:uncharacterized protein LOC111476478 [Cucurbita maxima]|uniref:Uncharacterized protein LOC111476478 n=1 Tax=Cucurbita maxima TaxID=3661 RepID=A0A6J1IM01_CUCMA|nr:uncharacterized protein LOC111476478 [Cucurbita maxima]